MSLKPKKLYYKIGEVAELTGVEAHTLRYWETELEALKARKNRSGHRIYTEADIELIQNIKHLTQVEGLTLQGVQARLKPGGKLLTWPQSASLGNREQLRQQVLEIRSLLERARKLLAFKPHDH